MVKYHTGNKTNSLKKNLSKCKVTTGKRREIREVSEPMKLNFVLITSYNPNNSHLKVRYCILKGKDPTIIHR